MALHEKHDPPTLERNLRRWLSERIPHVDGRAAAIIGSAVRPAWPATTSLLVETTSRHQGTARQIRYEVRVTDTDQLPDGNVEQQYRLLRALEKNSDIPTPSPCGYEEDPVILGAPFLVVRSINGRLPSALPPYPLSGWFAELTASDRATAWWESIELLARVHRLDLSRIGLPAAEQEGYLVLGLKQRLDYFSDLVTSSHPNVRPILEETLGWLRENVPDEDEPPGLLWDGRLENLSFSGTTIPVAAHGWEWATLGAAEEGLAWFCYVDRHHSEGLGIPRLPGLPGIEETLDRYERLIGRPLRHLEYYEILAAFRFGVLSAWTGTLLIRRGTLPAGSDFPYSNTAIELLAQTLGRPMPVP